MPSSPSPRDELDGAIDDAIEEARDEADEHPDTSLAMALWLAWLLARVKSVQRFALVQAVGSPIAVTDDIWWQHQLHSASVEVELQRLQARYDAEMIGKAQLVGWGANTLGSARAVYEAAKRAHDVASGLLFERRILDPDARHCWECPKLAALGWRPTGTLPLIGSCPCRWNCRCHFERISPLGFLQGFAP